MQSHAEEDRRPLRVYAAEASEALSGYRVPRPRQKGVCRYHGGMVHAVRRRRAAVPPSLSRSGGVTATAKAKQNLPRLVDDGGPEQKVSSLCRPAGDQILITAADGCPICQKKNHSSHCLLSRMMQVPF